MSNASLTYIANTIHHQYANLILRVKVIFIYFSPEGNGKGLSFPL